MSYFYNCTNEEEVKREFRKHAFKCHPDHGGNADEMVKLQKAYEDALKEMKIDKEQEETNRYYRGFNQNTNQQSYEQGQYESTIQSLNKEIDRLKNMIKVNKDQFSTKYWEQQRTHEYNIEDLKEEVKELKKENKKLIKEKKELTKMYEAEDFLEFLKKKLGM